MRKSTRFLGLFGLSAVISFVLSFSGVAKSTTLLTISSLGCGQYSFGGFVCPLVHTSTRPLSSMLLVYYDYVAISGHTYTMSIGKHSPTGSIYTDSSMFTAATTGQVDKSTSASNVLTNPNQYDLLYGHIKGSLLEIVNGRGMTTCSSM